MATFGYTNIGTEPIGGIDDRIQGNRHTCPENGQATSITAYLELTIPGSYAARAALLRASDLSLVGCTNERTISADGWHQFDFPSPVNILGGVEYWIIVFGDYNIAVGIRWDTGISGVTRGTEPWDYDNGCPDPLSHISTQSDRANSIYCTYTPEAVPCSSYTTQAECEAAGCYWYNDACHSTACADYLTQAECEAAGCYWYSGACHSEPAAPVTTPEMEITQAGAAGQVNILSRVATGRTLRVREITIRHTGTNNTVVTLLVAGGATKVSFDVAAQSTRVWSSEDGRQFAAGEQPAVQSSDVIGGSTFVSAAGVEA